MFRGKPSHTNQADDSASRDAKVSELRAALGPLSGRSLKFCTDACLRRFLEARNWNLVKAMKMLEETLRWRSSYKPEEIRWNTSSPEGNIRHLVYLMENAILNLPEGQEQMTWLIDFNGWSLNTNIPIKTARDIIYILQNHYPERLAIVVLYSPPRFFEAFWKVVKYFIDEKTSEKIKFVYPNNKDSVELMKTFFDTDNLPSEFGGKATLNYDHEEFSRLMTQEDVKTAKFWGFDNVASNTNDDEYSKAKVTPGPVSVASAAS